MSPSSGARRPDAGDGDEREPTHAAISGVVVACLPEHMETTARALEALPFAEIHYRDARGRLVVTIEATGDDESTVRLRQIQALPHVLSAELAAYHLDPSD